MVGVGHAKPNRHVCRWMGVSVSGAALQQALARMELRGEGRAASAGMWRRCIPPCVRRLVFQGVVTSTVTQRAHRVGNRGTHKWRCLGTDWTGRPEEETRPMDRTARGRVDAIGHTTAALRG